MDFKDSVLAKLSQKTRNPFGEKGFIGGAERGRTADLLNAIQALSQTELQPHRCGGIFS
jgi:hypothetical protein